MVAIVITVPIVTIIVTVVTVAYKRTYSSGRSHLVGDPLFTGLSTPLGGFGCVMKGIGRNRPPVARGKASAPKFGSEYRTVTIMLNMLSYYRIDSYMQFSDTEIDHDGYNHIIMSS